MIQETNTRTKALGPQGDGTHVKSNKRSKQTDQFAKTGTKRSNHSTLENNEGFSLAKLLDSRSHESVFHADPQIGADPETVLRLKRKRRRKKGLSR